MRTSVAYVHKVTRISTDWSGGKMAKITISTDDGIVYDVIEGITQGLLEVPLARAKLWISIKDATRRALVAEKETNEATDEK